MGWIMDMRVRLVSPSPSPAVALGGEDMRDGEV